MKTATLQCFSLEKRLLESLLLLLNRGNRWMCGITANTQPGTCTLPCEEAAAQGAPCGHTSPFHRSVEDKWAGILPPCMLDEALSIWRELMVAHGACEASRLRSIAHLFLFPHADPPIMISTLPHRRDWNAKKIQHILLYSFTLLCLPSSTFFFYSLWFNWSSGIAAARPVTCWNPEPGVFADDSCLTERWLVVFLSCYI